MVSDYFGVAELERKHHVAANLPDAGRKALGFGRGSELPEAEGCKQFVGRFCARKVAAAAVDQAVGRTPRAEFCWAVRTSVRVDAALSQKEMPADRALASRAAREAVILLKNDGALLPLDATAPEDGGGDRAERRPFARLVGTAGVRSGR